MVKILFQNIKSDTHTQRQLCSFHIRRDFYICWITFHLQKTSKCGKTIQIKIDVGPKIFESLQALFRSMASPMR